MDVTAMSSPNSSTNAAACANDDDDQRDGGIRIGDIYIPPPPLPALTLDATGPRLTISSIATENFKSYGGQVTIGPLQKNFTAIIGPNGSGKSNVIDALLFVFGYRAQKIRSKTVGVLVHSSDKLPNVTSCSVSVNFQLVIDKTRDDYEVVEGSEFVISRTASKDNSSYYSIDGRRVQFKEVSALLRSKGIDLDHNRFLILQGEVEQISLMKPKSLTEHDCGMLEYLEDIIGSCRLKEPIEILSRHVSELNEQRSEKLNRVKAVEKEKDDLEGVKNEAMEYLTAKNNVILKENILKQCEMYDLKTDVKNGEENAANVQDSLKNLVEKANEVNDRLKERKKVYEEMNVRYQEATKLLDDVKDKFAVYEKQDARWRQDLKHANARKKELNDILSKENAKLVELNGLPQKLEKEILELQQRRITLDEEKSQFEEELQKIMASLHLETKSMQDEKEVYEAQLLDWQPKANDAKAKMSLAQVELDLYLKNEIDERNKLTALQNNYENVKKSLEDSRLEIKKLEQDLPNLQEQHVERQQELNNVTVEGNKVSEQLRLQRIKLEQLTISRQHSQNRGRLLERLMQEKSSGNIAGIIGRLGDLGAIDEKYDVAISTACGQLEHIVTDTLDTAQRCVEFLKKNNLGHATFIGLDKMACWKQYVDRRITTPQNVPRLFDLIKVKNKDVLPAFYFALRDTLVADNINQATEIGLQGRTRNRVVTLNGEVIDIAGTMSGGGTTRIRGRMGTAVVEDVCTNEELQSLRSEIEDLLQRVGTLRTTQTELEDVIQMQQREMEEKRHSLEKHKMEVEALTEQEPELKQSLIEQKEKAKAAVADKVQVNELTNKLEAAKKVFNEMDDQASALNAKVQSMNDRMRLLTEGKLNAVQKRLDGAVKTMDAVDSAITKNNVKIKTTEKNITKTKEKITSVTAELADLADRTESLKKELKEVEVLASDVMDEIKNRRSEVDDIQKEISVIREGLNSINAEKSKIDGEKLEINHKLNNINKEIKERRNKIVILEKEISKLKLEPIDFAEKAPELPTLPEGEIQSVDLTSVKFELKVLKSKLNDMKPNLSAIDEYRKKEELYLKRIEELDCITQKRDERRQQHDDLRKQRLTEFMNAFSIICYKLKETYQMLTLGGDAELELVNTLDPFSDGVVFSVRPPRKSWKNISNLSGGEKTLSSLALVFALHYYKPTPFYVMDEIDAALDFRNVAIVGHYIKEQTKNAQFIVISLRNNLFELADRLVGIYKTYNTSHSVALNPHLAN